MFDGVHPLFLSSFARLIFASDAGAVAFKLRFG